MKTEIKERIEKYKKNETPDGFKKTKYGILPIDWKIELLVDLTEDGISNGIFNDPIKVGKGVKLINVVDLYQEPFIKTENLSRLDISQEELKKYKVKYNDIFFTRSSLKIEGIAHCNINTNNFENLVYDGHIMRISPQKDKINPVFLRNFCLIPISRKYFMKKAKTTTMTTIGQSDIAELPVYVPSLNEQNKIATILSSWDKAIELREQLIEEKKQQKKGLMKKLLTGEFRLPGFDGEWKEVKIGTILKERCETKHNSLELLAITGKNGIVKRTEVDIKDNSNEDKSKYKRICPLDIGYNTMRMWQGVSGVSEYEGIVSPAYTILAPTENIDSYFIGYLFKFPKMINIFWRHSQGMVNDTLNLKYSNLKNIKVKIPKEKSEQSEIAKMLMTIDKNIELIEVELSAIRIQKKGLMQLLLTGIIRVNL